MLGGLGVLKKVSRLIPTSCFVCGRDIHNSYSLCPHCERQLPWIGEHCHGCGLAFEQSALQRNRCGKCLQRTGPLDGCHGLFHYRSPIDKLIPGFKFQARLAVGDCMGRLLARAIETHHCCNEATDLLIPVPLHWRRYLQRGFNQSWELCKVVSRITGIPCDSKLLEKRIHTLPQAELGSATERARNLRGAFLWRGIAATENVKTVTIIDDVITTMSTVSMLATLLKAHGIQRVEAWCVARASISRE